MVSSHPFTKEELIAYRLRLAVNPSEAFISPEDLEQCQRIKRALSL